MEEEFYNKIKELSIKLNETNMYFLNLKNNINDFNFIFNYFKINIENKHYLFKCFYDLFIIFLKNISGFIMYLKIYEEYTYELSFKSKDELISHLDRVDFDILQTFETYQNFNFKQLLLALNMDTNLTNINIQDLISLNIERDKRGNLKSPYLDNIVKVNDLPKKDHRQLNNVKNIENFINYLHYLICNYIYNIIKLFKEKDLSQLAPAFDCACTS